MGAVRALLRADLRRWASTVVLVLLIGVGGGAVLGALAGARRTASSYERMLEEADAADVLVNPADGDTDFAAIEALPQVVDSVTATGAFVVPRTPSGEPDFGSFSYLPLSGDANLGRTMERPVNLEGRLPYPDRADEAFLSTPAAEELGVEVGDTIPMVTFSDENGPPEPIDIRVVGVGLFSRDALQDEGTPDFLRAPAFVLGPAFLERQPFDPEQSFRAMLVQVRPGTLEEFLADAQRAVGDEQLFLQTRPESTAKAERALRPYATALSVFAAVSGLALVLVVGQALTRHLLLGAEQAPALAAIGFTRRQQVAAVVVRAGAIGAAAAVIACALAAAISVAMPIGPAADLEPDPGFDLDGLVLGAGLLAIVGSAALWGYAVGRLVPRPTTVVPPGQSRVGGLVTRLGVPPIPAAGIRMALERGRGRTAVPVATTLAGAALGLTALVAALSFGANLNHFLDEPRLYGWGWDAAVEVSSGDEDEFTSTGRRLEEVDSVTAIAPAGHGQVQVDGVSVPAVGIGDGTAADSVLPPLLEGRNPRNPREVALGTTTLRRIDREVGDEVTMTVGTTELRMKVVGRSVFPLFGEYPGSDKTGLGVGAALTIEGLRQLVPRSGLTFYLVDLDDDADRTAALADLRATLPPGADDPESYQVVLEPQRPEDLAGYDRVNTTPLVLAGLLAVLALGTTAHGLVITTNRRRRDLAMLKTFGCTRRQLSAVVAWQATTVGVIALAIGVPLGVAAGRRLWILLADRLGTVPEPVTPILVVLVAVPATLAVVNLVAAIPGRRAGAIPTAVALRGVGQRSGSWCGGGCGI